ncbi:MAG TPA: hypothetical protein VM370_09255 [Candidatus Thermoplasmatota archaeon]|nr:hypothetical protein [Candidatus Thermoplasmatota archaeon]
MPDTLLTTRDALLGVLVGAILADGKVVRAEVREAELQALGVPHLDILPRDVRERLPEVKAALARQGEHAFLEACVASLTIELKVRAFRAVSEIIAADHEILPAEERYLARLATAFDIVRQ